MRHHRQVLEPAAPRNAKGVLPHDDRVALHVCVLGARVLPPLHLLLPRRCVVAVVVVAVAVLHTKSTGVGTAKRMIAGGGGGREGGIMRKRGC